MFTKSYRCMLLSLGFHIKNENWKTREQLFYFIFVFLAHTKKEIN